MEFIANPPRRIRAHCRRLVETDTEKKPLYPLLVVGPKIAGRPGWWYATVYCDNLVAITNRPVVTRDIALGPEAIRRFGKEATEYQAKVV